MDKKCVYSRELSASFGKYQMKFSG